MGETKLSDSLFYNCTALKKIVIPEGVTEIGSQGFGSCKSAAEVVIPKTMKTIGSSAFRICPALTEITIPENVESIGTLAFDGCTAVRNYYVLPVTPPVLESDSALEVYPEDCRIHVPKGCLEAYQTAEYWSTYADYMVEMEE